VDAGCRPDAIAPDGSEIFYRVSDAERASMVEVRLPAGAVSKPVRHRTVEEIWYFLAGQGRVWLQPPGASGRVRDVGPTSVVVIPTGWAFQFAAGSEGDLRFLCFTSPPWPGSSEAQPVAPGGL
jgi:mannose-6-phosphate isomerase-like protein (cupin superfamily)